MDNIEDNNLSSNGRGGISQAIIVDALRTYPLEPAPPELLEGIMREVQDHPRSVLNTEPFRLSWFDFAISLFVATMVSMVLAIVVYSPQMSVRFTSLLLQILNIWRTLRFGTFLYPWGWLIILTLVAGLLALAAGVMRREGQRLFSSKLL